MDVKKILKDKGSLVEPVMRAYLKAPDDRTGEMLLHVVSAGGKRIRPALLLTACEAVGGDPQKSLSAAASVELLHSFTLVHDDIMDDDLTRRGKPTVHAIWGVPMGIVIGDTLYAKAFESLVDARKKGVDEKKVLEALEVLNKANSKIHEGQIEDMLFEERDNVNEKEYLSMVQKKTGALIEASLKIGAILGGGTKQEINALANYGRNIGAAFQIQDDLLDLTADEKKLGKPVGSDIRQGKKSLIIVHATTHAKKDRKQEIIKTLKKGECSKKEVEEVIRMLDEEGSIEYAKKILDELTKNAKKELKSIRDSEPKETLIALADYIIERTY